ncbi:MAG: hypothetical protein DI582_01545 [Azospirillum brasilense]|nr:MAG: hypothetical protein DI582_01545 [Azospirillum brasilense]
MSNEECLPTKLKEEATSIAAAKLVTPQAPTVAKHVYFTEDQRLAMGYDIAEHFFTPYPKLTRSSVAVSLEANELIAPEAGSACGEKQTRTDIINAVSERVTNTAINRETAKFLSEHYSDLQISDLYRVAKAGGDMSAVPDDSFIIADAKDATKQVNIKPTTGRDMGSILSYTTSRTVSNLIRADRKVIEQIARDAKAANDAQYCAPKVEAPATAVNEPAAVAPDMQDPPVVAPAATAEPAATPSKKAKKKTDAPTVEQGASE